MLGLQKGLGSEVQRGVGERANQELQISESVGEHTTLPLLQQLLLLLIN